MLVKWSLSLVFTFLRDGGARRAVEQQVWTLATCIAQRIGAIIMLLTVQGKFSLVKLLRHHHRHSAARRPVTDSTALATAGTIADTIADK